MKNDSQLAEGWNRRETAAKKKTKKETNKIPNNKPGKKMEIAQIIFC